MSPTALFVGMCTIDIQYAIDRLPNSDEKRYANSQLIEVGGPATNAAVTFAQLGGKPRLVTQIGSHWIAGAIQDDLVEHAVEVVDLNPADLRPPVLACSFTTPCASRSVVTLRTAPSPTKIPDTVLDGIQLLLVDGHHMSVAIEAAKLAQQHGIPVVFDGGSWKPQTETLLPFVDIAICSAAFSPPMHSGHSPSEVLDYLREMGVTVGAITQGNQPFTYFTGTHSGEITPPQVPAIDTLGAGDIFHGAFCYDYLSNGREIPSALTRASEIAALSCESTGTRSWFKSTAFRAHRMGDHP